MSKVILDAELKAKLNGLSDQIELCDPNGQTMGRYVSENFVSEAAIPSSRVATAFA